jgi:hypothetical protein
MRPCAVRRDFSRLTTLLSLQPDSERAPGAQSSSHCAQGREIVHAAPLGIKYQRVSAEIIDGAAVT